MILNECFIVRFGRGLFCYLLSFFISVGFNLNMSAKAMRVFKFRNNALSSLPFDKSADCKTHRIMKGFCYTKAEITPVEGPRFVAVSPTALKCLGVESDLAKESDFLQYFSGNKLLDGSEIAAHTYCGHQYGFFSGQLGDGATVYVGEIESEGKTIEFQLKGCGRTPFSRAGADGRKVLRSTIREFLASEVCFNKIRYSEYKN